MLPSQDERLFVESPDKIRIVLWCMPGPWVAYLLGDVPTTMQDKPKGKSRNHNVVMTGIAN